MIEVYQIKNGALELLNYDFFKFNGGEVSVKFKFLTKFNLDGEKIIVARINNSDDFMFLAMIQNALLNICKTKIHLVLPYIPYGRQDRICDGGEAFSLKVFANLLNSLNFDSVLVFDPHSDVGPGLINNVNIISQLDIISKYPELINVARNATVISPDAGANKKTFNIAQFFQKDGFVRADKLRDMATGKIKETIVYCDDFNGKDIIVFDDLCEKGGTFLGISKIAKARNCEKFILYVTHGLFPVDINCLHENGIDEIFTTNSFRTDLVETDKFHVLDIMKFIKNQFLVN